MVHGYQHGIEIAEATSLNSRRHPPVMNQTMNNECSSSKYLVSVNQLTTWGTCNILLCNSRPSAAA